MDMISLLVFCSINFENISRLSNKGQEHQRSVQWVYSDKSFFFPKFWALSKYLEADTNTSHSGKEKNKRNKWSFLEKIKQNRKA